MNYSTAALVAVYIAAKGLPTRAIHRPRFTMAPLPRSAMAGAIAPTRTCGARMLTASMASRSASGRYAVRAAGQAPALLTKMSMRPSRVAVASRTN